MLKIEVNKSKCSIEIVADLQTLCADISTVLGAIDDKLTEQNAQIGHQFKILFTKGFMDGICFSTDREHMEHYLAEGDKSLTRKSDADESVDDLSDFLDGFIRFLKAKRNELEKATGDESDEAQ